MKRVLIGCECSQVVCSAFRKAGFLAFSCDIRDAYGGHPEWHIKDDLFNVIDDDWSLVICHPPCTYLSKVNNFLIRKYPDRLLHTLAAVQFFNRVLSCSCPRLAVENPVPLSGILPPYTQLINPYDFGHFYKKQTCLWLRNLPVLLPTSWCIKSRCVSWVWNTPNKGKLRQRYRSETFPGVAAAMVDQWKYFL